MKKTFGILLMIPFLVWAAVRLFEAQVTFPRQVGGYMINAATANTIELATKEMAQVVGYLDRNRVQPGFTSAVYNTPNEDVGFWMSNMRSSLDELKQIKPDATSLEKSNVLIKLRETLTSKTKDGSEISVPAGISIYPHNVGFMIWAILSAIVGFIGLTMFVVGLDE